MTIAAERVQEIGESLTPPACLQAILAVIADLDVYGTWSDDVSEQKITKRLQEDSNMHRSVD